MSILEDLWYGQIDPAAQADCRNGPYLDLVILCERNENKLLPTLNQEQQENFQKIKDLWEEMSRTTECSAFITGFRLAVQMMTASV